MRSSTQGPATTTTTTMAAASSAPVTRWRITSRRVRRRTVARLRPTSGSTTTDDRCKASRRRRSRDILDHLLPQKLGQPLASTVEMNPDGGIRAAQDVGDLRWWKVFEVAQHHGGTLHTR